MDSTPSTTRLRKTLVGCNKYGCNKIPFDDTPDDTCIVLQQQVDLRPKELSSRGKITSETGQHLNINVLLDSGCTHSVIDEDFVCKKRLKTFPLQRPSKIYNADGSAQKKMASRYVDVTLKVWGHQERIKLIVADLGKQDLYLGYDWCWKYHVSHCRLDYDT